MSPQESTDTYIIVVVKIVISRQNTSFVKVLLHYCFKVFIRSRRKTGVFVFIVHSLLLLFQRSMLIMFLQLLLLLFYNNSLHILLQHAAVTLVTMLIFALLWFIRLIYLYTVLHTRVKYRSKNRKGEEESDGWLRRNRKRKERSTK